MSSKLILSNSNQHINTAMKTRPTTRPPTPRRVPRRMVKTLHARAAASEQDIEEYESDTEPNMKFSHALIVVLALHILAVGGVFAFNALKTRHIAPDPAKSTTKGAMPSNPAAGSETAEATGRPAVDNKTPNTAPLAATTPEKSVASKPVAETGGQTYTVAAGDTLTRIAAAHKTSVEAIEQANGIGNNSSIRIGQVLKIPLKTAAKQAMATARASDAKPVPVPAAKAPEIKSQPAAKVVEAKTAPVAEKPAATPAAPATTAPSHTEEGKPATSEKSYTVAKGDNPYAIAKKFKISYNDLIKANNIQDPTKLQIGQKLIIP